jgi:hypothetical protein
LLIEIRFWRVERDGRVWPLAAAQAAGSVELERG